MVRALAAVVGVVVIAAVGLGIAAKVWSGATLRADPVALARVATQPFAGSVTSARASVGGRPLALRNDHGRLTPADPVAPGALVRVDVTVRRPSWSGWLLGAERHETLTVRAPVAHVLQTWLTVPAGTRPVVRFDEPVARVTPAGVEVSASGRGATLASPAAAGTLALAVAARSWESLGEPQQVTWFAAAAAPPVTASPPTSTQAGGEVVPASELRLTFAGDPVEPSAPVAGRWQRVDAHTIAFHPAGGQLPFYKTLHASFPRAVTLESTTDATTRTVIGVDWQVAGASFLRLEQLLAQGGYLPLDWTPSGADVERTGQAELAAAVRPPAGKFTWRYPNTPPELKRLWRTGKPNVVMRGAVMMFQHDHGLSVDAIAGPQVWTAVLADAAAGKVRTDGYSYVWVHKNVPQKLTLWHNGTVVLTSPGNTGVPQAPTAVGTWPVFEHIPSGRMQGTNPDGTHYDDPGVRWVSYFHGGEALHAFNRTSFGTPQSLGCVELPLAAAAKVWPYTPIGVLVTIEN